MGEFVESLPAWAIAALCLVVWNAATFAVTAHDKRAARRGERRTPERRFIWFAATLGGAGVLIGFYALRHKTRKTYLLVGVWTLTIVEYALLAILLVML